MQLNLTLKTRSYTSYIIDETVLWKDLNKQIEGFPTPNKEILPGLKWGCFSKLFTPAYWKLQYLMHNQNENFAINFKLGENILEEVVACLLGGFGLKSEIGLVAFDRLKMRGLVKASTPYETILDSLMEPFMMNNKNIHYRFPNQKSKFISRFLNRNDLKSIPIENDMELRKWLLSISGIGPKTASWITRNYLGSERVAIIDIHIFRAFQVMGLFPENYDIQRDYFKLEEIYLLFCQALNVQPSKMDALMWLQMKGLNRVALKALNIP